MDEQLHEYLQGMEARLMTRINGVLERLSEVRADLRDLRTEHDTTRELVTKLPATILGAIEQPLLRRVRATEGRLDKLEGPRE